jgi:hypothetical protein
MRAQVGFYADDESWKSAHLLGRLGHARGSAVARGAGRASSTTGCAQRGGRALARAAVGAGRGALEHRGRRRDGRQRRCRGHYHCACATAAALLLVRRRCPVGVLAQEEVRRTYVSVRPSRSNYAHTDESTASCLWRAWALCRCLPQCSTRGAHAPARRCGCPRARARRTRDVPPTCVACERRATWPVGGVRWRSVSLMLGWHCDVGRGIRQRYAPPASTLSIAPFSVLRSPSAGRRFLRICSAIPTPRVFSCGRGVAQV